MKSKLDELDVDRLKLVPTDLKKLRDAVDKEVVKKDVYDELVKKVHVIHTSELVKKTDDNPKVNEIKDGIHTLLT